MWRDSLYFGLFVCYMKEVNVLEKGNNIKYTEPTIQLVSCAPIKQAKDEDKDSTEKEMEIASKFNTNYYAKHFESVFKILFHFDIHKWAVCAIADNTSTNHKIAHILGLKHVPCNNHV